MVIKGCEDRKLLIGALGWSGRHLNYQIRFRDLRFQKRWLMANHSPERAGLKPAPTTDRQDTAAGVLARLWWMLAGNAVLALSAVFILHNTTGFFHTADVVFWCAAASLVLIRYLDIRFLNGLTATGAPASARHWIKYTILLLVCSAVVWALAHAASRLFAGR
jgi:hypothetical protein